MQLSKSEEQLMQYLWKLETAYMKDLLDAYPEPRPATTTVATLLKRMSDKHFVAYNIHGKSREYYPLVKKKDYFSKHVNGLIKNFFNEPSFINFSNLSSHIFYNSSPLLSPLKPGYNFKLRSFLKQKMK